MVVVQVGPVGVLHVVPVRRRGRRHEDQGRERRSDRGVAVVAAAAAAAAVAVLLLREEHLPSIGQEPMLVAVLVVGVGVEGESFGFGCEALAGEVDEVAEAAVGCSSVCWCVFGYVCKKQLSAVSERMRLWRVLMPSLSPPMPSSLFPHQATLSLQRHALFKTHTQKHTSHSKTAWPGAPPGRGPGGTWRRRGGSSRRWPPG